MYKLENKYVNIDPADIASVYKALNKKQLSSIADIVKVYEQDLSEYFKVKYAHACNSGTAGIELILRAIGVKPDDEVILPPTGPVMCILPIIAIGAKPVFVDVYSSTSFGIDVQDLIKKITPSTKALLVVPMWGYPIAMEEIMTVCKKKKIIVIEDASHCHGSLVGKRFLGTLSDVSILSTQERKLVTTGEGGIILTNNPEISQSVQEMRNFGRATTNVAYFDRKVDDFGSRFGLNFRINAMSAALGISQLKKLNKKVRMRIKNAEHIRKELKNVSWLEEISILDNTTPNYYSIVFRIKKNGINTFALGKYLEENGVISDTYRYDYQPLYQMKLFKQFATQCPNAEVLTRSIFTLPTHEGLTKDDLEYIVSLIVNYNENK